MKSILQKIIQKRNPAFQFDSSVDNWVIIALVKQQFFAFLRGLRLLPTGQYVPFVFLDRGVRFFNRPKIQLGKWTKIGEQCYLSALGKGQLKLGDNVGIGAYSRLIVSTSFNNLGSHIHIGNNVGIGEFAYLGGAGGLEIGDECIVGQYFSCHPENHNYENLKTPIRHQGVSRKGIKIGRNCWIGSKVTILDGVTIGDNCIIAAGAVVTKNMPDNAVIGGVPARVLKSRIGTTNKGNKQLINENISQRLRSQSLQGV